MEGSDICREPYKFHNDNFSQERQFDSYLSASLKEESEIDFFQFTKTFCFRHEESKEKFSHLFSNQSSRGLLLYTDTS